MPKINYDNHILDRAMVWILIAIFIMGTMVGSVLGVANGKDRIRKEAIDAGVAEYVVDSKTGEVTFKWLSTKGAADE